MKIGFDVAQSCQPRAGCAWYADSLVRAMVAIAPEHHFCLYHQFGDWINPSTDNGTCIDATNVTNTFTDITPEDAARIWRSPPELLSKTGAPDIVHATSFRAPKVPGAKLVFTVYDVSFWAKPHFTTESNRQSCQTGVLESLRNADGFLFISRSARNEFERFLPGWLDQSKKPWAITPLAPRDSFSAPAARTPAAEKYFLAVGSLEPRKNYETLLDAVEIYWRRSGVRTPLWIAGGSGWRSQQLKERLRALETCGEVRYLGYVPDSHLRELMTNAQALIFPSWYEGFGLPVLEAMACGCPVICSNSTSLPEAGGPAPLYVSPTDALEIAHAMERLETDAGFRAARVEAGIRHARQFDWKHTARCTLDFYSTVLADK